MADPPPSSHPAQPVPLRHGSVHTTFSLSPAVPPPPPTPRSSAPSPSLPAYSPPSVPLDVPLQDDYKEPLALPPSPPTLLSDAQAYDWDELVSSGGVNSGTGWGSPSRGGGVGGGWGSPVGDRGWSSPRSSLIGVRSRPTTPRGGISGTTYGPPTFAESIMAVDFEDEPRPPPYGDGVLQELLLHDLLSPDSHCLPTGYMPAIDPGQGGDDLPLVLSVSVRSLPAASPTAPNPPTLAELRTLLPPALHLTTPFLPRRWLPFLILSPTPPPLLRTPDPPLPTFEPLARLCTQAPAGQPQTHHFHHLPASVSPISLDLLSVPDDEDVPPPPKPMPLDLYFCCRCPTYVVVPPKIQPAQEQVGEVGEEFGMDTVIPNDVWAQYVEQRMHEPPVGMHGPEGVVQAMEVLLKMLEQLLWQHRTQGVKVRNPVFVRKLGWNDTVAEMIKSLGWTITTESQWQAALRATSPPLPPPTSPPPPIPSGASSPPVTSPTIAAGSTTNLRSFASAAASPSPSRQASLATSSSSPAATPPPTTTADEGLVICPPRGVAVAGSEARNRLLRAWVEIGAFVQVWRKRYPELGQAGETYVYVADLKEEWSQKLGVEQMFAFDTPRPITGQSQQAFNALGLGPRWTPSLVQSAYALQTTCHRTRQLEYFSCLVFLVEAFPNVSDDLGMLVAQERSRGRVTIPELKEAYVELGFGEELMMAGEESTEEHVWMAFEARVNAMGRMFSEGDPWAIAGVPSRPPPPTQDVDMEESAWVGGVSGTSTSAAPTPAPAATTPSGAPQAWLDRHRGHTRAEVKQSLKAALETVAAARQSTFLVSRLRGGEVERAFGMDPESAYAALDVMRETEDEMVLAVWASRVADAPGQADRWAEAVRAIAKDRGSFRLQRAVETGLLGLEAPEPTAVPLEYPRGLDQLGNTCYLNSLLQYFYTIRELRETIVDASKVEDDVELIDSGALESRRVGGRLITKRELTRSTQFVRLLSFLFMQLSVAETPSVTPELELAKLALVTSQDEDEDKAAQQAASGPVVARGGETATTSDATLVDEPMPMTSDPMPIISDPVPDPSPATTEPEPEPEPERERSAPSRSSPPFSSAPSVLGKRDRNNQPKLSRSVMDIDSLIEPSPAASAGAVKSPRRASTTPFFDRSSVDRDSDSDEPRRASTVPMEVDTRASSQPAAQREETPADVDMQSAEASQTPADLEPQMAEVEPPPASQMEKKPPPLPPRSSTKKLEVQSSEPLMMFGRQHDVSECMDNCMFQIEAALKPDPGLSETSLVKRLFYGKLRQRLTGMNTTRGSIHERDDLFAHLHVNVGDENFDLYDGLAGYFEDVVEFEGQDAKMEVTLVDPPPLLQIQLQRVQFNRETLMAYKSNAYVKFGETLCMDRFLESADPQKRERTKQLDQQLRETRNRIKDLTQNKKGSFIEALENTRTVLSHQKEIELPEWDEDLSQALLVEREELVKEIQELREHAAALKAELEDIWANDREAEYELSSVFMHRGSHTFGHYWFYSRWLPDQPDKWFKYNDSNVTLVPKQEVLGDGSPSTANPYLLVFARKGSNTIDTVKRLI